MLTKSFTEHGTLAHSLRSQPLGVRKHSEPLHSTAAEREQLVRECGAPSQTPHELVDKLLPEALMLHTGVLVLSKQMLVLFRFLLSFFLMQKLLERGNVPLCVHFCQIEPMGVFIFNKEEALGSEQLNRVLLLPTH